MAIHLVYGSESEQNISYFIRSYHHYGLFCKRCTILNFDPLDAICFKHFWIWNIPSSKNTPATRPVPPRIKFQATVPIIEAIFTTGRTEQHIEVKLLVRWPVESSTSSILYGIWGKWAFSVHREFEKHQPDYISFLNSSSFFKAICYQ